MRALSKEPADRYQHVCELKRALIESTTAPRSRLPTRLWSWVRALRATARKASRAQLTWAVMACFLSVVLLGAVWSYIDHSVKQISSSGASALPDDIYRRHMNEGQRLFDIGDDLEAAAESFASAAAAARQFGALDPRQKESLIRLRECYLRLHDTRRAEEVPRRLADLALSSGWEQYGDKESNALKMASLSMRLQSEPGNRKLREEYAGLLNDQATLLYQEGSFARADELLQEAAEFVRSTLGDRHPLYARTISNEAYVGFRLGRDPANVERLYKQALDIRRAALGAEHPDTARSMRNLAEFYRLNGRPAEAEPLLLESVAVYEKSSGQYSADVAWCLNNLGLVYTDLKEYPKAADALSRSYAVRCRLFGRHGVETGRTQANIGRLAFARGDNDGAVANLEQAVTILEKGLGVDHPDTGKAMGNLAAALLRKGENRAAESYLKRVISINQRIRADDPVAVEAFNQLIELYRNEGRLDKARKVMQRLQGARQAAR